ncbi:MAG: hypothetical protein QM802_03485 [Agriterribacter sp.]
MKKKAAKKSSKKIAKKVVKKPVAKSGKPSAKKSNQKATPKAVKKAISKNIKPSAKKRAKRNSAPKPDNTFRSVDLQENELMPEMRNAGDIEAAPEIPAVEGFPASVLMQKGNFVLEKINETRFCCMEVMEDGRREAHVCFKTENAARTHILLNH